MKRMTFFIALLTVASCTSVSNNSRKISSLDKDLTGTYLGIADYGSGHNGPNTPAIRIYFDPIKGENDKYNAVLLEYVDLLKMAPSYIASNKLPLVAKTFGYLKNITRTIAAYEVTPGSTQGTFEMRPLVVVNDRIEVKQGAQPRILTLASDVNPLNPLEGATISSTSANGPKEIFFPKEGDDKKRGVQYRLAKTAYEKAKLESTWRKNFLKGPYLSQYYNRDDVVLKLTGEDTAEFIQNPKHTNTPKKKRMDMFTNAKSAFLQGEFTVTEPRDGMFLFNSTSADVKTKEIVQGKIGLFIDIFDATKSLNQDVVELALIDSEAPEDFLMYYEDPQNGEGTDSKTP